MWILALINVSRIVSRFWVRVPEIRVHEIKAYNINHLSKFEHVAVCLDGLLEGNVVESYISQVCYLPEH